MEFSLLVNKSKLLRPLPLMDENCLLYKLNLTKHLSFILFILELRDSFFSINCSSFIYKASLSNVVFFFSSVWNDVSYILLNLCFSLTFLFSSFNSLLKKHKGQKIWKNLNFITVIRWLPYNFNRLLAGFSGEVMRFRWLYYSFQSQHSFSILSNFFFLCPQY